MQSETDLNIAMMPFAFQIWGCDWLQYTGCDRPAGDTRLLPLVLCCGRTAAVGMPATAIGDASRSAKKPDNYILTAESFSRTWWVGAID